MLEETKTSSLSLCCLSVKAAMLKFSFNVNLKNQGTNIKFKWLEKYVHSGLVLKLTEKHHLFNKVLFIFTNVICSPHLK